jgi:thiamine biosynthesis lipoprotein
LWRVLELAERAERWSDGLVTPTILFSLEAAGYDRPFASLQAAGMDAGETRAVTVMEQVRHAWKLNAMNHTVTRTRGTRLDLGGVAKGWAAEQAANYLGELGAVMVDAGGDMVMTSAPAEGAWHIGMESPLGDAMEEELPVLKVEQSAVATSGRDFRKWTRNGKHAHHVIDPRTNLPAITDVLTATVIAPTIFHAEAAAKVVLLLGSAEGLRWAEGRGDLAVLVILESGKVERSRRMEQFTA